MALDEPFAEASGGARHVQYFDKARMEDNAAVTDKTSPWRVTTGLLVDEMVNGQIQVGERQFTAAAPSTEVVAGDANKAGNPRYSDFKRPAQGKSTDRTGQSIADYLKRDGVVTTGPARSVRATRFVPETGHNIPDVFWEYMNRSGPVENFAGRIVEERLFDWVYVMGYPITEAYWVEIEVAGKKHMALLQLFQRRTLSYVADFPAGWQVQMGNAGLHYYDWRYNLAKARPAPTALSISTSLPAATPTLKPDLDAFVGISGDSFTYAGAKIKLKGTNYWLSNAPFAGTWSRWDGPKALAELEKARDLGINTIRIGIPYDTPSAMHIIWEDPRTMAAINPLLIDQMKQLLQIASYYGMKVIFVLYEFYDGQPAEGEREEKANRAYLNGIVEPFAFDDRVLAWDLRNEPDNYSAWKGGRHSNVIEWLERTARNLRYVDKIHPITVGVGDYRSLWQPSSNGTTILDIVDFAAFHCYNVGALSSQIAEIKRRTGKPVLLEEMGWPTARGQQPPRADAVYDEPTQTFLYTSMLQESKATNIAGVVQWTLSDYTKPISPTPSFEDFFGLVRRDGTFKPAALIFKNNYEGRLLPSNTLTEVPLATTDHPNIP